MKNVIQNYLKIDLDLIIALTLTMTVVTQQENFIYSMYFVSLLALPRFGEWWMKQHQDYQFFPSVSKIKSLELNHIFKKENKEDSHISDNIKKPKLYINQINTKEKNS